MADDESQIERVERVYYPDGSPKEETHYRGESCHGPWRLWHPNGVLGLEWWYENHLFADGVHREWFPNGKLKREVTFRGGRQISEVVYNSKGMRVPTHMEELNAEQRARIEKWAAKARAVKLSVRRHSTDSTQEQRAYSGAAIQEFLAGKKRSAKEWLGEAIEPGARTLGEMDHAVSMLLVDSLLGLGAAEVLAVKIESRDDSEHETTNHLVVELPEDAHTRARVFAFVNAYSKWMGFDAERDEEQSHLYLMLC